MRVASFFDEFQDYGAGFLAFALVLLWNCDVYSQNSLPVDLDNKLRMQERFLQKFWVEYDCVSSNNSGVFEIVRFVSDSKRFFYREEARIESKKKKVITERSFDGRVYYQGAPSLGTPIVVRYLGDNPDDPQAKSVWLKARALEAVGIQIPTSARKCLDEKIEPTVLFLNRIGNLETAKATNDGYVLRYRVPTVDYLPARIVELSLSQKHNFAVAEWTELSQSGKVLRKIQCSDFFPVEAGQFFLPRRVVGTVNVANYHDANPKQTAPWTYKLNLLGAGVTTSDVDFTQNSRVGSVVAERSTAEAKKTPGGEITYQVPENYENLSSVGIALYARKFLYLTILVLFCAVIWSIRKRIVK